jgi:hypothetical protein
MHTHPELLESGIQPKGLSPLTDVVSFCCLYSSLRHRGGHSVMSTHRNMAASLGNCEEVCRGCHVHVRLLGVLFGIGHHRSHRYVGQKARQRSYVGPH